MTKTTRLPCLGAARRAVALGAFLAASTLATSALAQNYRDYSCEDLWYARNSIYAENGFCFKTDRARETFGRGCFPPYGKLNREEKRLVATIQMWEQRKYCD
jgi:hypothetical protein